MSIRISMLLIFIALSGSNCLASSDTTFAGLNIESDGLISIIGSVFHPADEAQYYSPYLTKFDGNGQLVSERVSGATKAKLIYAKFSSETGLLGLDAGKPQLNRLVSLNDELDVTWELGQGYYSFVDMAPSTDGTTFLFSWTDHEFAPKLDFYSSAGTLIWSHSEVTSPELEWDSGGLLVDDQHQKILMISQATKENSSRFTRVVAIDFSGQVLWSKDLAVYSVTGISKSLTSDGGFVLGGLTFGNGSGNICLNRFDRKGNFLWEKRIEISRDGLNLTDIAVLDDNSIVLTSFTDLGASHIFHITEDGQGTLDVKFSDNGEELLIDRVKSIGTDFIVGGRQFMPNGDSQVILARLDRHFNVIWKREYHAPESF